MFVLSAVMTQNPLQTASAAVNAALQFNGTNQYVTFGAAPSLGCDQIHARDVVHADRRGTTGRDRPRRHR